MELSTLPKKENINSEILSLRKKHNSNYNTFLLLNSYNSVKNKSLNYLRAFADVIENFSREFIIQNKIPACFMYSQGWNNIGSDDVVSCF